MAIFQDSGRRHVRFLKFEIFNGRTSQEGRSASPCQIWSKSVKPRPRYGNFSIFPRWRPSAILDLLCVCSDNPQRAFGGLYRCAKFGSNRCSSFDNMHVFRFCESGLKTPIHAPKSGVLGILPAKCGAILTKPKKGTSLRESESFEPSCAKICQRV